MMTMKQHTAKLTILALAASLWACSDNWDKHYDNPDNVAGQTVLELIQANPELSKFARMIEIAGYDKLLGSSQTFTVFAPVDAALGDIDLDDVEQVKRLVANHISRFSNSSSTSAAQSVKMYNGKHFEFDGLNFGGSRLLTADVVAKNGVLHTIASQLPYHYNLREYIDTHASTSSIAAFIARFDERKLDPEASVAVGVDDKGQTVYDSVLVNYNPIFDHKPYGLGSISAEDSVFTMIIPDNQAWAQAYERISPYFKVYDPDQAVADSISEVQTSLAILGDLVYRREIHDPASQQMLMSTSGSEISDPLALFDGTSKIEASNGLIYLAPRLNYDNVETWNKEIEVEGEVTAGRTPGAATSVNVRSVTAEHPLAARISEMRYIEVTPTSPTRQPSVTISIPDVLSGKYDIYVSMVPGNVIDSSAEADSTKLSFTLSYMGANGRIATKNFRSNDFVTKPTEMSLIKVAEAFEFPVSNFYDRLWYADELHSEGDRTNTTSLFITTNVSAAEFNKNVFTRRFRLDRIIFVPIKN